MKRYLFVIVLIISVAVESMGQMKLNTVHHPPDLKLNTSTSIGEMDGLWSNSGYFVAIRACDAAGSFGGTVDSFYVISGEVGYGFTQSDEEIEMLGLYGSWSYSALPFISLEYRSYLNAKDFSFISSGNIAPPVMIHAGLTGGTGALFLFLPFGINGTAGLSSDFRDLFFRYGVSYDVFGFSIGYTGFINLTKNGPVPGYLSSPALEIRLFLY